MKRFSILVVVSLLTLSACLAAPIGVKEKSPPGRHEAAVITPDVLHLDVAVALFSLNTSVFNHEKTSAGVTAPYATAQKYASHVSDVSFAPLYRWYGISAPDLRNGGSYIKIITGDSQRLAINRADETLRSLAVDKPDVVPRK